MRNLLSMFAVLMAVALMGAGCLDSITQPEDGIDPGIETGDQAQNGQGGEDDILDDEPVDDEDDSDSRVGADSRNVTLKEQNDSGENGGVMLTEENGKTRVVVTLTGVPDNVDQPAHIHLGVCPNPGAVLYPLNPVVDGRSETVINSSLADILNASSQLAINVHKSSEESNVYVACGDIDIDGPSDTN